MTERGGRRGDRRRAREAAVQMLYQWEVGRTDLSEVADTFWKLQSRLPSNQTQAFAAELVRGTVGHLDEIDSLIASQAEHWRLPRMAVVDRLILRLATHELLRDASTPPKVVISEALEIAKRFSSDDAAKFINGILDGIHKRLEEDRKMKIEG